MTKSIALKNGLIINGSGSPGYYGTILIKDNKISLLLNDEIKERAMVVKKAKRIDIELIVLVKLFLQVLLIYILILL